MKDKIYKLNRPKGFFIFKRAAVACLSAFICSIAVAVPLSILIYTNSNETATVNKSQEKEKKDIAKTEADEKIESILKELVSFKCN